MVPVMQGGFEGSCLANSEAAAQSQRDRRGADSAFSGRPRVAIMTAKWPARWPSPALR